MSLLISWSIRKRGTIKQNFLHTFIWLLVIGITGLGLPACQAALFPKAETITIALPALEQNALIYIAADQGFFKDNGLSVTLQDTDSGVTAMQALLQSQADLAVAAEFPVARSILQQDPAAILASIDKFENDVIVGRKDRGITNISDLRGKRIGVALQTINEFYLGRFLELNHIRLDEVTLVNLKPSQFVPAMVGGQVDAIIAWQPYIHQIEQQEQAIVSWPAQNSQSVYGLLVSRKSWLVDHPETAVRFLKALLTAEDYLTSYPDQAKGIVQKRLQYDDGYVAAVWPQHQFSLTLDYSLIVAMTDEARWMIKNHLTAETQAPDFTNALHLDSLQAVKPEAVDIRR